MVEDIVHDRGDSDVCGDFQSDKIVPDCHCWRCSGNFVGFGGT